MRKESVQKFDLEAAFKALNEVEVPVVKGIRPNREDLQERFTRKLVTDVLVEDYYDVGDSEELGQAQEEREAEIAKAKLARIEKIVDLEAETEEDLLPSYVGKLIIQCPQCMTLFYKSEEDIERSEENPDVVNLNEPCQHCGNSSGYTLIGKVDTVGEEEASQYDAEDFEENELDLDFDEEEATEEPEESTDEGATEEETDEVEDVELEPMEDDEAEEEVQESLREEVDKDLEDKLKAHNDYIDYLKGMINQEEEALKKAENEFVKKAIQRRLDAFKADLEEALPAELKGEVEANNDLPTPEEVDLEDAAENKEDEKKEKKESLTEDLDAEHKLEAEEAALDRTNAEDYIVEATKSSVMQALDALEAELTEEVKVTEAADFEVSDAEFKAMLKSPVFNEACKECKEELEEGLPPVDVTPFEKAADAIEAAGSELTPEEQKLEDEELAAKEGVDESLVEDATAVAEPEVATDLLADDGTFAMLIYPERFTAEERKEKLLADPDFVKTLEVFATRHKMLANPEDLEDGVSAEEDMYDCTFEGIEGEDLEDTLDELISYYLEIKAGGDCAWATEEEEELTEAPVATAPAPSKLKRNYSTTELIVKELKEDPLFAGLSMRTIQRILLPYYISNMGRGELSAQAMIDFFTEEGFAPYVLDHFFQMDPLARKELLKADAKFMEIFNAFAKKFKMFPTAADEKAPGESDFDFAFSVAFDMDENGVAQDNEIARETIEAFGRWYVNGKFDETLVADLWEAVEDFDEKEFNKLTENYLITVYSNVNSFETTSCSLDDNKLIVEGVIKFASGKTKNTTFTYEAKRALGKHLVLEGLNADFATEKAFVLNCKVDTENCLIVESLNYKYTINNTLVEGLLK